METAGVWTGDAELELVVLLKFLLSVCVCACVGVGVGVGVKRSERFGVALKQRQAPHEIYAPLYQGASSGDMAVQAISGRQRACPSHDGHSNLTASTAMEARGTKRSIPNWAFIMRSWSEGGCHHQRRALDFC